MGVMQHTSEPPQRGPAWRWLWAAVVGAIAVLIATEASILPHTMRSMLELGAALAAIIAALVWVRANREALARADLRDCYAPPHRSPGGA